MSFMWCGATFKHGVHTWGKYSQHVCRGKGGTALFGAPADHHDYAVQPERSARPEPDHRPAQSD